MTDINDPRVRYIVVAKDMKTVNWTCKHYLGIHPRSGRIVKATLATGDMHLCGRHHTEDSPYILVLGHGWNDVAKLTFIEERDAHGNVMGGEYVPNAVLASLQELFRMHWQEMIDKAWRGA
jgi:hypothetical protein